MLETSKELIKNALFKVKLADAGYKQLLLTFDDGPSHELTAEVLDLLAQYNVKSVFFVVGNRINGKHKILDRILTDGHHIGNHSFDHKNGTTQSMLDYYEDIKKCQELIKEVSGVYPKYFRPPMGLVSFKSLLIPKLLGLETVLWSLDVNDWQCKNTESALTASHAIVNSVKNNDIVLLHDANAQILTILEIILPQLHEYNLNSGLDFL